MNKFTTRAAALLLAALTVFLCAACGGPAGQGDGTTVPTEPVETEPETPKLTVFDAKGVYFKIIRPDEASSALLKSVGTLRRRFDSYFSVDISPDTDFAPSWIGVDDSQPEILIGLTNRQASKEFYDRLPEGGYGYTVTDHQIVILGRDDSLTAMAINAFDNQVLLPLARKTDTFMPEVGLETTFTYAGDTSTVAGILKAGMTVTATLRDIVRIGQFDNFTTAQGGTSDGKYWYSALKKKVGDVETDVIIKTDMETGKRVAVSEELPLDHCNDMCWNPDKNLLLVPNMVGKRLTLIDPETLEIKDSFLAENLPGTPYAVSYNKANQCYIILAGGLVNFVDCENFTVLRSFPMISMNYTGQGVDSDENYVYIPMSKKPDAGSTDNVIVTYNIKNGGVVAQIHIDDSIEIETMVNLDGVYYAHFNTGGSVFYRIQFDGYLS